MSEEPTKANTHEATWEHMQKEAAQKLIGGDRHQLLLTAVRIVFPTERHLAIGNLCDSMVGDGDPMFAKQTSTGRPETMGIACQVLEHILWSSEGPFRINDPIVAEKHSQKRLECFVLREWFQRTGEL